ncbi:50S ribosomal protein L11 methyltransferase [Angustibacter peucedani]
MPSDLAGLRTLLTPEGWALLESLPPYDEKLAMPLGERLRGEGHDPALVAAALTQSRLRAKAHDKLGPFADAMLLTPDGLEQATRLSVAAHHARRYVGAGVQRVADLSCGLGSDAMALAGLDRAVLAIDADELTAAFATINLRHWPDAEVRCHDVTTLDLEGMLEPGDGIWLDPARRTTGKGGGSRRTFDPEAFSPPYSFVLDVASRFPATGAKLAPGIAHRLLPDDAEAQWVSVGGDVVECALWTGRLAREGVRRSALLLDGAGSMHEVLDDGSSERPPVGPVGAFLHEPDGAVVRAGLVGEVAAQLGARLVDPTIAYLTTDAPSSSPLVHSYAVEEVMPFHLKALRAVLRDRGVGTLTIKKRGSAVDPVQLRRQLRLTGDAEGTIALTRVAGRPHVLVLRPL